MKHICTLIFLSLLLTSGCIFPAQPDVTVNFYTLDYQPPVNHMLAPLNTTIKIARFTSSQEINTQSMIFSSQAGLHEFYNYSRWRVYPADLCGDYLARDLRHSGLTHVVAASGVARFRLEGAVDDFIRIDRPEGSKVRLAVNCTLMDQDKRGDISAMILFQRNYIQQVPVQDDSPLSMALAMSQAMAAFSQQLQGDIYLALQARLQPAPAPNNRLSGSAPSN